MTVERVRGELEVGLPENLQRILEQRRKDQMFCGCGFHRSMDPQPTVAMRKTTGQSQKQGGADAADTLFFSFFGIGYAFIVAYGVGDVPDS